jgi:hypothetical protein
MWKEGLKFAGKLVAGEVVKKMKSEVEPEDDRSEEQKRFDRRIKLAKVAIGFIYPPAGKAIMVLETAPVVTKYVIKKVGELRKSDEDDDDEPLQRDSL